ncbi:lactate dehydrogenase, partial [Lactobacillus sp. XV13L]|nr:lactate dehydrogenase [Lactobacillus sp. XV13L]
DELFKQADIVSIHVPYFPGKNDRFINENLISLMKPTAILVNTARAEIVDVTAVVSALEKNQLGGFATDVIDNEKDYLGKKVTQIQDKNLQTLVNLYPRAIITPHIGSYTQEALHDMIAISYDNFNDILTTGTTKNLVED